MKWYQSLYRWALMVAVGIAGIAYLARGLSGNIEIDTGTVQDAGPALRLGLASDLQSVVDDVNAEFEAVWTRDQVDFAEPASWCTVSRRISLALIGSGVSLEDMRWLESLPETERTAALLDRLLSERRFTDYWAQRLSRAYVGADEGPFIVFRRRRFETWLSDKLYRNTPYSEIVHSLITGKGIWTQNPEVNFLTVTMDSGEEGRPDPIRLAARTSRAFLGMRIDCLQCHDDFLGNVTLGTVTDPAIGTQHDFHQLAAFYSTAANSIQGIRDDGKAYEYQFLDETETEVVEPDVPFLEYLLDTNETNARKRLADWVTHVENLPAARAAVNRVWALMFGKPLSDPVDDLPLHGPFPPGLDRLAHDFADHHWDLHRLIRIIANLDVFQIDSRCDFDITNRHENAWAVFPLVRLRPEQVAGAMVQACRLGTIDRETAFIWQLQAFGDKNDFVTRFGDTGEDEFNQDAITITQRLLAMNGKLIRERTQGNPIANAGVQVAMFARDDAHAIEITYLAVLNRKPTEDELAIWLGEAAAVNNRTEFIEDLYWMLLNGSEFYWNH